MRPLIPFVQLLLFFASFSASAQDLTRSSHQVPDSIYYNEKGVYVTICGLMGTSVNTDNNYKFDIAATRLAVNWRTQRNRKFAYFAQIGTGWSKGSKSLTLYETGFLIGRLVKGRRKGFLDLNVGLSAIGRKAKEPWFSLHWGPTKPSKEEVREIHTIGIPVDLSVNTSKGIVGIGIGVTGNLNANQPYAAINVRLRFGSPIRKEYYGML